MLEDFVYFHDMLKDKSISFTNKRFDQVLQDYYFILITDPQNVDTSKTEKMAEYIQESTFIIIDQNKKLNIETKKQHFIIGFEKTLIILNESSISFLIDLMNINKNIHIYFLNDTKNKIQLDGFESRKSLKDVFFEEEIRNFNKSFYFNPKNKPKTRILEVISSCLSGYLIKKSYSKIRYDRINNFIFGQKNLTKLNDINEKDYVELRIIGTGSLFRIRLVYFIETGKLMAIKEPIRIDMEIPKLKDREKNNYLQLQHPFLPEFYGTLKNKNEIFIEFINGQTLDKINANQLSDDDLITIIFQLILIIEYLHENKFIIRDMKPNNLMIDKNNTLIMIDMDRIIKEDQNYPESYTGDFALSFLAPESIKSQNMSYKSDIFSFGKTIEFLINTNQTKNIELINQIIQKCTNEIPEKRPSISELAQQYFHAFHSNIKIMFLSDIYEEGFYKNYDNNIMKSIINYHIRTKYLMGVAYENGINGSKDINKAIYFYTLAAEHNFPRAQFVLGKIYNDGKYVARNINKAIYYYSLASDQNDAQAQYNLGVIYEKRDISKAIHYYSLAANQNHPKALCMLGFIYLMEQSVPQDINKAINYLSLAADLNNSEAQFSLGLFYERGKFCEQNVNKAIYYYSLAANQNNANAQFNLGELYLKNDNIPNYIQNAINYFKLAANNNHIEAQYNLGTIYSNEKYYLFDINLAIHYLSLAANNNHPKASFSLGNIYYSEKFIPRNINKAIENFFISAKQNQPEAQYNLGVIFSNGKYVSPDINKAIYYFSLAANHNNILAQYNLGVIYSNSQFNNLNIDKAVHFYSLAANKNHSNSQYNLGLIYLEGLYIKQDINKAIHYFSLAAYQNHIDALYNLGIIYSKGEYVKQGINKAIHYFSLAAYQNHKDALYNLGIIYSKGEYVKQDINKAIHYYSLAANQNDCKSQYNLGSIFSNNLYCKQDINKSIHYYSLAANQNDAKAQYNLGCLYLSGEYIKQDIDKAIHYFSLAANQNIPQAQLNLAQIYTNGVFDELDLSKAMYHYSVAAGLNEPISQYNLGYMYEKGIYISQDINKAIHYYSLAAKQNLPQALYKIGFIYSKGLYVKKDMNKAIHYYNLAASLKNPDAQFDLGCFYYHGKYLKKDIKKAIDYFTLAANQSFPIAQYYLGIMYYCGDSVKIDIKKGIYLIQLSLKNGYNDANFVYGYILHEGKNIPRNMKETIHYYKNASSFNNQLAKNNLGVIYKYGIKDEIPSNPAKSIEYFEEAIRQKDDLLSKYNLSLIYIYDETIKKDYGKAMRLLIQLSQFNESLFLLTILLVKQFGINKTKFVQEIEKYTENSSDLILDIMDIIKSYHLDVQVYFENFYEYCRNNYYLYDVQFKPVQLSQIESSLQKEIKPTKNPLQKNISNAFYEGFGYNLL